MLLEKYKKMPITVKAAIWFVICSMLQKGITFITTPIFTRLLSASEYGQYALFLSWQEVISIFATLNLNYQVFNNGMVKFKDDKDGYTSSMVGLAFISSLICYVIIAVFYKFWFKITNINFLYVTLMFVNMFGLVVIGLWTVRRRYEFDYKKLTIVTVLMALLNPALGVVFVYFGREKVLCRIFSIVLTTVVFALIVFILLVKQSKKIHNKDYWKYALKIDLPLIPHYLSMVLLHSSDRIMIGKFIGDTATAFYSVSYSVAMIMQMIINSINGSFIPWVYQQMGKKEYKKINKYSTGLILFMAVLSIIPIFFAPEAIMILGTREYMDAATIIPVLSVSVFMIYTYSIFIIIEMYFEKSVYVTIGSISAAALNIVLNAIFIPLYGYKMAGYTTLVSYIALSIFHYLMMKRVCKEKNILEEIFNVRILVFSAIILVGVSALILLVYDKIIIRYSILCIILLTLLINKQKIGKMYKSLKNK